MPGSIRCSQSRASALQTCTIINPSCALRAAALPTTAPFGPPAMQRDGAALGLCCRRRPDVPAVRAGWSMPVHVQTCLLLLFLGCRKGLDVWVVCWLVSWLVGWVVGWVGGWVGRPRGGHGLCAAPLQRAPCLPHSLASVLPSPCKSTGATTTRGRSAPADQAPTCALSTFTQ